MSPWGLGSPAGCFGPGSEDQKERGLGDECLCCLPPQEPLALPTTVASSVSGRLPSPCLSLPSGSGGAPSPGAPVSSGLKDPEGLALAPSPLGFWGLALSPSGDPERSSPSLCCPQLHFPVTSRPIPISVSEQREVWGSYWKGGVWEGLDR